MVGGEPGMADEPGDEPPAEEPKYDQDFFLALAAKGKDAWNAWRRDPANKDVRVTFAGVDFSESPRDEIDFSGFEFGDKADFSGCKWRGIRMARRLKKIIRKALPRAVALLHRRDLSVTSTKFTDAAFGDLCQLLRRTSVTAPCSTARPSSDFRCAR